MFKIDNCRYCAAITYTNYKNLSGLLIDAEKGDVGCWLCNEDGSYHTEYDVYENGRKIWCGHAQKCNDIAKQKIKGGGKVLKKVILATVLSVSLIGCSFHGMRSETGNPINEANVRQIVNGKTVASEVLGLFGAPYQTTTLGSNEIYIYKNCKVGGAGVSVAGIGHTGTKERCNSLSITIDKASGVVQSHNHQKMFDTE